MSVFVPSLAQQQTLFEKQQVRIAEIEAFVTRFKAKASKAKQAQSRLKELARMENIAPAHVDSPFQFRIDSAEKTSTPLFKLEAASLGYPGQSAQQGIVRGLNFSIEPGQRIGLLGRNGAGKSTLIKTLAEELPMLGGDYTKGEHLQLGYYAQHQLESLDTQPVRCTMQNLAPEASEQQRDFLGGFDFHGDKALEICDTFSGGERRDWPGQSHMAKTQCADHG